MKIIFTKHASKDKFATLAKHGFPLTKRAIKETIMDPDDVHPGHYPNQMIASKKYDARHDIRVVYKKEHGILTVVTFYPARAGRYSYEN